jgi:SpoVK/Ycf46/Vps4 family AAA+-type ATPase
MIDNTLPEWWKELTARHRQDVGRVFVFHDNVNDVVYYPNESEDDVYFSRPHPFRDMLIYLLAKEGKKEEKDKTITTIFYASATIPLTLYYLSFNEILKSHVLNHVYVDQKKLRKEMARINDVKDEDKADFGNNFPNRISSPERALQGSMIDLLFYMEPYLEIFETAWFHMVFILDFFERITTQSENRAQYKVEEMIRRWALSDNLKRSKNMVIGLTVDLNTLPELLRKSDSQIQKIKVPMPNKEERFRFLEYWSDPTGFNDPLQVEISNLGLEAADLEESDKNQESQLKELAGLTKGFRLLNLETMVRMSKVGEQKGKIDEEFFKKQKFQVIKEESFGLLEEIPPKRGFEAIGGITYAVEYFKKLALEIPKAQTVDKSCRSRSIPKGILLVGPPGTGKTILAEALASQGKMTLVKMGDVRGSLVGQSERNMSMVLNLLEELSPVVVFVDEIDQSIGRRSAGPEGDSGTNRRLFGKMLEFMGDNNHRGDVLWIGASNRPDLLDNAMISRFDAVMAILHPYALEERKHILEVMEENINVTYSQEIKDDLEEIAKKLEGSSGRAIETIVRRASDLANSAEIGKNDLLKAIGLYKPNTDIKQIDEQTIYALMATNFTDMLPDKSDLYPERLRLFVEQAIMGEKKSNLPLKDCLEQIKTGSLYSEGS